jgi:general stress protein YciG
MAGRQGDRDRSRDGGGGRGFAAMDDRQQREIARKGGSASAASQGRDERGRFTGDSSARGSGKQRSNPGDR